MSKFLRVDVQKQPWGYARVGGMEMSVSLSVHEVGCLGVAIGDVVAVSHVWGDAQYEVENVQGASHRIKISSPEKMRGLLSIAQSEGWENLWLDNICINQEDDDEKSREVMKMGYVYRETRATVVLLDSTRSELLREFMPQTLQFQSENTLDNFWPLMELYVELGRDVWYERLWTVQESTLASTLYMAPVDEDVVYDVSGLKDPKRRWFRILPSVLLLHSFQSDRYSEYVRLVGNLTRRFLLHTKLQMITALRVNEGVKCSEEKDRVYGILGLVPNVNITPAYGDTTLENVAVMVMKECVNNLKQMDLLHLSGPKLKEMGKRMVPAWESLMDPNENLDGSVVHHGNCTYDENVGLLVSSPRVFPARILAVIEPDQSGVVLDSYIQSDFNALKEKLHDDQMVELIRGMMLTWSDPQCGDEVKARKYFDIWAHVASLYPNIVISDVLKEKYGLDKQKEFNKAWISIVAKAQTTIILGITKDNVDCSCSSCKRTFISCIHSDAIVEDNLLVVDYGGHISDHRGGGDDGVPLIVGEQVQEGVKFISTIVLDRGILHESMASQMDAITIV